jgi:hypothetical protein
MDEGDYVIDENALQAYREAETISVPLIISIPNAPDSDTVNFKGSKGLFMLPSLLDLVQRLNLSVEDFKALYNHNAGGFVEGGKQGLADLLGKKVEFRGRGNSSENYSPR